MTSKKNLTPAELEKIRQEAITDNLRATMTGQEEVVEKLDLLIELLKANRDHIGGFVCVVVAKEGTTMVDPDPDVRLTGEMFSFRSVAHTGYIHPLTAALRSLLGWFKEVNTPSPMAFISAMLRDKE